MTLKRSRFLALTAGAAAVPGIAGAQLGPQYQQPLAIAINAPVSTAAGSQIVNGVQAAIDETNRYGGIFGSAFMIRQFDDNNALAQSIVNIDSVTYDPTTIAAVAGYEGDLIAASLDTYARAQIAVMVPATTADVVTSRGFRNVFRLPTKDSTEGRLAAQFIAARFKPKMTVSVAQDNPYGPLISQGFAQGAGAAKMQCVEYQFPAQNPDFAAAARAILTRTPEFVYLCGNSSDLGPLIPALRAAGYKGNFGASQGFYNSGALRYAADFANGIISTSMPPFERMPESNNALSDFKSRYPVTAISSFSYAAAQIVMMAARRAGATSRLALLSALQTPTSYNTIAGAFQFGYEGDPIDPLVYFYTPQTEKFRFVAPSHATPLVL